MFPKKVLEIAEQAATKYGDDIPKAVAYLDREVRKLPEFPTLLDDLWLRTAQELIYDVRNTHNRAIKRASGAYGGPSKVVRGLSETINEAAQSVYDMAVAGKRLGSVKGCELSDIARTERALSNGHVANAILAERLQPLVRADLSVEEEVGEKQMWRLLRFAQRKAKKLMAA